MGQRPMKLSYGKMRCFQEIVVFFDYLLRGHHRPPVCMDFIAKTSDGLDCPHAAARTCPLWNQGPGGHREKSAPAKCVWDLPHSIFPTDHAARPQNTPARHSGLLRQEE